MARVRPAPKPRTMTAEQRTRFERFYAAYPRREHRPDAESAWRKLDPDDAMTDRLIADAAARLNGRKWAQGYIELPASYLNKRVWEDDIETTWQRAGPTAGALSRDEQRRQTNMRILQEADW